MAINRDVSALLREGIEAAKRGDRATAADLLQQVVDVDERNEQAWLWLSGVVDDPEDVRVCLENVLEINPSNARAASGLRWLEQQQGARPEPAPAAQASTGGQALPPTADEPSIGGATSSAWDAEVEEQPSPFTASTLQAAAPSPFAAADFASSFNQPAAPSIPGGQDASPGGSTPIPASPFGQQPPASPFGQQPPASPFGQPAAPPAQAMPSNSNGQYLPFGQAAPPPREVPAPTPTPPAPPPAPEPEGSPFATRRREGGGGLASRLGGASASGGDDLNALRSTLFGGGPSTPAAPAENPRPDTPSSFAAPSSSPFAAANGVSSFTNPSGSEALAVNPFTPATSASPLLADNSNPFAQSAASPFAAPAAIDPYAAVSPFGNGAFPSASAHPFTPPDDDSNPFGISNGLRPFSADDLHDTSESSQNGNGYAMAAPDDGAEQFPGVNPFIPPVETRAPVFTPRPPEPPEPPRQRGLMARPGMSDLMSSSSTSASFGSPAEEEPSRPSSPMLIARPPIPGGGTRTTPSDVATFPCPNCRKLVPENALSCPQCSFQFYARCPNCGEYVDTTVPSSSHGDHCPSCGIIINLMELGRAGSTGAAPTESESIRPRSTAAPTEGMSLLMPVKGFVEPTKRRRSLGRLIYQILVILILIGIIVFAYWFSHANPVTNTSSTNGSYAPTSAFTLTLNDVARANHALAVDSKRLDAAVARFDGASSLSAIIAAQQGLSDDRARLALYLDRANGDLAADSADQSLWYSQYHDKVSAYLNLSRANLAQYQQALDRAAPLWAFLKLYYASNPASFDLSSLGQPQAVSNSDDIAGLTSQWQAWQQQTAHLSRMARDTAAAIACPCLNDMAADLDNFAELDRLHIALLGDALNRDTVATQQDSAAVQLLAAEMKTQSFYHPSLLEAASMASTLKDWYATQVSSVYDQAAITADRAGQLYVAAQRQLTSRLADNPDQPTVGAQGESAAAQSASDAAVNLQLGDY